MVLRELLLSNILFVFILSGCQTMPERMNIIDPSISKEKGVYYWNGSAYTGVLEEFDETGNKSAEYQLINGQRNGISRFWWPGGYLKKEAQYQNGVYHGYVKVYYKEGQLRSWFNYDQGQESGKQQIWKKDGRMKANYEVINGRKYGLTGVKNCVNVFEEEGHFF